MVDEILFKTIRMCMECKYARRIGNTDMIRCIAPVPLYLGDKGGIILHTDTDATYCEVFDEHPSISR